MRYPEETQVPITPRLSDRLVERFTEHSMLRRTLPGERPQRV